MDLGEKYTMKTMGQLISYTQDENTFTLQYEKEQLIIKVIREDIINFFIPLRFKEHYSKAVEEDKSVPCKVTAGMKEGEFLLETKSLKVRAGSDLALTVSGSDNRVLMHTHGAGRKSGAVVSEETRKILEAEGHDASKMDTGDYPVQLVLGLDEGDDFYGLGDKSGFLNKKYYEYENWNSDIPQAHNEDYHALYKSVPVLFCKKKQAVYGLFFDNTFHSYLNLGKESTDYFYYGADDGNLDVYFMGGEHLKDLVSAYTYLTGRTPLPQRWTLGYQQSRWSYESADEVMDVAEHFRSLDIPCDAIHLDIDYMDGYRVFTWNNEEYGQPGELTAQLKEKGFKTVTIIDPGTKVDDSYFMCREGEKNHYFATDPEGKTYVNEVWPGDANYPDFGRKEVRDWWGSHHKFLVDAGVDGIWNDMNEPASFRGELPADVVFHDEDRKTSHAEMHNVYGHYMSRATFEGLQKLTDKRPFVITRAAYAGTQKYSTVWTGDNQSLWSHLQMMVPQLCNLGMSGFAFAGTDIGGFGADTTPELLTRWIEAACFSPLFRNHSCKGTRRQEPWQFGDEVVSIYRKYVKLRYRFLPYLYDLFYQGEKTGLPVMRPLVLHYEEDRETYNMNGEFLVGENLLVAPVLEQGSDKKMVYLPRGTWYDFWTGEKISGGQYILRDAPIDVCPIYVKAGTILPMYEEMSYVGEKPLTTLKLLCTPGEAHYEHFQDDGETYAYRNGAYNLYAFDRDADGKLKTTMLHENYPKYEKIIMEELVK